MFYSLFHHWHEWHCEHPNHKKPRRPRQSRNFPKGSRSPGGRLQLQWASVKHKFLKKKYSKRVKQVNRSILGYLGWFGITSISVASETIYLSKIIDLWKKNMKRASQWWYFIASTNFTSLDFDDFYDCQTFPSKSICNIHISHSCLILC